MGQHSRTEVLLTMVPLLSLLLLARTNNGAGPTGATPLSVPSFLSDNMVLQRNGAAVWGWADRSAEVVVKVVDASSLVVLAEASASAAGSDGSWKASVVLANASNATVTITASAGANPSITLRNVAFGDVYLCKHNK